MGGCGYISECRRGCIYECKIDQNGNMRERDLHQADSCAKQHCYGAHVEAAGDAHHCGVKGESEEKREKERRS